MVSQKENNSSATEFKDIEYCNLIDKEFKIVMEKKPVVARGKGRWGWAK